MLKDNLRYRDFISQYECAACVTMPCCPYPCPPKPQPYPCCCAGPAGQSAYEIALEHGFVGTEAEWLASLKGDPGPFFSSYIEAVGKTQTVAGKARVVFTTDPDYLDVAGKDIEINASGTVFTIKRAGLYHVEWSVNLASGTQVLLCLLENGDLVSGLSSLATVGNHSSGALINVKSDEVPYEISLYNFAEVITIADMAGTENNAASIRILRFADGPAE